MSFWQRLFGKQPPRRPEGELVGELRDGKKHGRWVEKSGPFLLEQVYRHGVLHGPMRRWRDDGSLFGTAEYVDGKEHGVACHFDEAGRVILEFTYVAGQLHGPYRAFRADGSLDYEREYREDKPFHGPYEIRVGNDKL